MEKHSPLDVEVVKEKIEKGQVKTRKNTAKKNKTKHKSGVKGNNGLISDSKIIAYLKTQDKHVTSTELRDACGFKSRTQVRRVLKRLAKNKHINIGKRKISDKRQIYTYGIA